MKYTVEASLLACDFARVQQETERAVDGGVDALHLDVMDGHFVPNLSMGPDIVAAVNRSTDAFLNVHLMMYNPYDYIEKFVAAGADLITIHFEATEEVEETLDYIRRCNIKAGLAFCPETSKEMIPYFIDKCDLMLLMTVHPGFGGQAFMPEMLEKIHFARQLASDPAHRDQQKDPLVIQVDGGIDHETAKLCYDAGANNFVAGTYLFGAPNFKEALTTMRQSIER